MSPLQKIDNYEKKLNNHEFLNFRNFEDLLMKFKEKEKVLICWCP